MTYPAGPSYLSSPDEPSKVYPERLIRPLPKRSLRSRLSQEAAELISFPPNLPSSSLPTYSPYGENGDYLNDSKVLVQHHGSCEHDHDHYQDEDEHDHDCPHHHHHCHHGDDDDELDSVDDASPVAYRHPSTHRSSPRSPRSARHARYGSYGSKTTSALDGYEAFENTNNKKKRKIPTSGSLSLHQSSLNAEFAHMGINNLNDGGIDDQNGGPYYGSTSPSGLGVQGAGRGRNSRKSSTRNPLGVSVNGSNARVTPSKYDQNVVANTKAEDTRPDQGIISTAIANATALLRNPLGKGQENVGVLDQQTRSAPTNSQFTFTCESEAKGVKFPEQSLYSSEYTQQGPPSQYRVPSDPTKSTHKYANQGTQHAVNQMAQQPGPGLPSPAPQKQKPRRRKGDVYTLAARQRKLQQEYTNLQHPPAHDDIWICEFCEYESIFGSAPHALIRQYEIKDRRERKRLAEKRRLLEKAKLKGRKGKKQSKNAAKAANNASQQPSHQPGYDQQPLDQIGDEYLDDGYDDDPIPMPIPPLQGPGKHSMPGSYNTGGGGLAGGGDGDPGGI